MSEEEHINEGDFEEAIKRKVVVRGGKKIRKKVTTKSGYRMAGGKQVRMSASEKRKRAKGAKKAARKRRGRMAGILRKRKKSLRKRKSLNMGESWSQNWVQSISQAAFGVMTEGSQKYYDPTYFGSHDQSLIVFVGSKEFEEVEFKSTFVKTLRNIVGRLNGRPQEDYKAGIMAFEFDVSDLNAGEITKIIDEWPLSQDELLELRTAYLKKPMLVGGIIDEDADFDVAPAGQLSAIVFRYRPPGMSAATASELAPQVRQRLFESGRAMVAGTRLDGEHWLKLTLLNPDATAASIGEVLDLVRSIGAGLAPAPALSAAVAR